MRSVFASSLYALAFSAISVSGAQQNKPFKIDFSVERMNAFPLLKEALFKRDGTAELALLNERTQYFAELEVGSNGDAVKVEIDTGSSDLWFMTSNVTCKDKKQSCKRKGVFDFERSSSFHLNSSAPQFYTLYGDGSYAQGFWGYDQISFGNIALLNVSFGLAYNSTVNFGILGVSVPGQESTYHHNSSADSYMYENFPMRLKSEGIIKKLMYSLYLDNIDAKSGSILFGAVDHAKYSGQLQKVPLIDIYANQTTKKNSTEKPVLTRLDVVLNSMKFKSSSLNLTVLDQPIAAFLDSGTSFTAFPEPIFKQIASALGGKPRSDGFYTVSCKYQKSDAWVEFDFSGAIIQAPISEFIMSDGKQCILWALRTPEDPFNDTPYCLLGDTVLRSAYVVYDFEDQELSLAQVKYSSTEDIEVVSGSIPRAVQAPNYSSSSVVLSLATSSSTSTFEPPSKKSMGTKTGNYFQALAVSFVCLCFVFVM